jgi:hypothetical protein
VRANERILNAVLNLNVVMDAGVSILGDCPTYHSCVRCLGTLGCSWCPSTFRCEDTNTGTCTKHASSCVANTVARHKGTDDDDDDMGSSNVMGEPRT